jgi:hypothetical protein
VQAHEGIVLEIEPQPVLEPRLLQPGVTVDVDLGGERQPSRQADGDQAPLGIQGVRVQGALVAALVDQARAILAGAELETRAGLPAIEGADQALEEGPLAEDRINQLVLAV